MLQSYFITQAKVDAYLAKIARKAAVKAEREARQTIRTGVAWPQHMARAEVNSQSFQDDVKHWLALKAQAGV